MPDENHNEEAEPRFRFPSETLDDDGNPNPIQRSAYLGAEVRFVYPLLGRHELAYRSIMDKKDKDGKPVGSINERLFAAALTIIESITFDDDTQAISVREAKYEDLPLALLRWMGTKGANYLSAVTLVPFA